jgi:hypothetical protein
MFNTNNFRFGRLRTIASTFRQAAYCVTVLIASLAASPSGGEACAAAAQDPRPLVEAIARTGCAQDRNYRTIAGVPPCIGERLRS